MSNECRIASVMTVQSYVDNRALSSRSGRNLVVLVLDLDDLLACSGAETFEDAFGGPAALPERDLDDILRKFGGNGD